MTLLGHVARSHHRAGSSVVCALGSLCGVTTLRLSSRLQTTHRRAQGWDVEKSRMCVGCCQRVGVPSWHVVQALDVSNEELSETLKYSRKAKLYQKGEESDGALPDRQRPKGSGLEAP